MIVIENLAVSQIQYEYSIHYRKQLDDFCCIWENDKKGGGRLVDNEITGKTFSFNWVYAF